MSDHYFLMISAAYRDAANSRLEAAGHGPDNFSDPLVERTGRDTAPPTHYWCGLHPEYLADFQRVLEGIPLRATKGQLVGDWNKQILEAENVRQPNPGFDRGVTSNIPGGR